VAFLKYASKQLTKIIDVCTSFELEWLLVTVRVYCVCQTAKQTYTEE